MAHAKYSPSSAHRWMYCPASLHLEAQCPQETSDFADEGTAAHALGAWCLLTNEQHAAIVTGECIHDIIDESVDPKWIVTEEMADNVQVYIDYVRNQKGEKLIEQRITFSEAIGVPEQFGTSDAIVYDAETKTLTVIDLKYGAGVKVFAENNAQMMLYAVGAYETFAKLCSWQIVYFKLVIVQPRMDHIDEWECTPKDLGLFVDRIRDAVCTAESGRMEFDPQPNVCKWCRAKAICPALQAKVSQEVFNDFEALDDPEVILTHGAPDVPGNTRLGNLHSTLDFIEEWCSAVRKEIYLRVEAGQEIIGSDGQPLRLAEGRKGHRKWKNEEIVESVLAGFLSPDDMYEPRKIITPSVADKKLNKKKTAERWAQLADLIEQSPGALKVVLGSDPSPIYSKEAKADEFEDLSQ